MRALLVIAVGLVIVAAQSENSKLSENLQKDKKEGDADPLVASGSDNNNEKGIVIKKRKNYEIVLYDYNDSGEEGQSDENGKNDAFRIPLPDFNLNRASIPRPLPDFNVGRNIAGVKSPNPDFSSDGNTEPLVWNPVKTAALTTTSTTTTRKPTTTTTTQRPTTTTTTTRRPTTTTTTQRPTTTSTTQKPVIISAESGEYSEEDSGDYSGPSDEANKVIRPFTQPQPKQIRPFNPLVQKAVQENDSREQTLQSQSNIATPSPNVRTLTSPRINWKAESPEEVVVPKVRVRKPTKQTRTTTTTSSPKIPPPPPENIFSSSEEEDSKSEDDIPKENLQNNVQQNGGRRIQTKPDQSSPQFKNLFTDEEEESVSDDQDTPKEFLQNNGRQKGGRIQNQPASPPQFKNVFPADEEESDSEDQDIPKEFLQNNARQNGGRRTQSQSVSPSPPQFKNVFPAGEKDIVSEDIPKEFLQNNARQNGGRRIQSQPVSLSPPQFKNVFPAEEKDIVREGIPQEFLQSNARQNGGRRIQSQPVSPPQFKNVFPADEKEIVREGIIPKEFLQTNVRQKSGRRITTKTPKLVAEEIFVPTTEKPFKTKVKVFTQPPPFRNPHVAIVSVGENPPHPSSKAAQQTPNARPTSQDDASYYSGEDDYSDSQVAKQNPQQYHSQEDLQGILKPNYNIPKSNPSPQPFGRPPPNFGVGHPLNQQKRPNYNVQQPQPPDSSGDDYSSSSSASDEDILPNSRKPIPRPEQRPPQPINVRPRPPKFNWNPKSPVESKTGHSGFRPPSEVVPGRVESSNPFRPPSEVVPGRVESSSPFRPPSEVVPGRIDPASPFRPPSEVVPGRNTHNEGGVFIPPSEVPDRNFSPKKHNKEDRILFHPPSKIPHSPRFNSSTRPKPSRPFNTLQITDHDDSSSSSESFEHDESLVCKDPTGKRGMCQEYFKCSVLYSNMVGKINLTEYKCPLPTQVGICCPIIEKNAKSRKLMDMVDLRDTPLTSQVNKLIRSNLPTSFAFGDNWVDEMEEIERELLASSITVKRDTPAFGHHKFFPTSKKIRDVSHIGFSLLQTSNDLSERLQLTNEVGGIGLKNFKSSNLEALTDRCPSEPFCPRRKYRTNDGSCNNLGKPKLGQSLTPLSRVLSPAYADGRWEPRRSVKGFELPSPRLLSQQFIPDHDVPNKKFTLYTMQFGQFIDHDISSVPMFTFGNNSGIDCCQNGQFQPRHLMHPNCFPIEIPRDDPFYGRFGQRCMNLVRSRMAPRIDCSLGYADQMNALTHWLDASNVYGSNEEEARELRSFNRGFLRFSTVPGSKIWLPLKNTGPNPRDIDYKAGDDRVNEMQGLMITHMVWFREHNRLADELSRLNPHWNDEQLYQESRRILIAEYQHVIYNEWLPIIIGRDYMDTYGILPLTRDFYKDYDPDVDSSVENSFSAAAFRMGHTLVQGVVRLVNQFGQNDEGVVISQHAENAFRTHAAGQVDKWIRGLVQQPVQNYDPFVTQHLNGRLFQGSNSQFGMDLSSLNIQRGRDHGIPGYNAYRELCQTGIRATNFDDFNDWIPKEMIDKMKRLYADVDDVDLWIGGLSETPLPGALIGPTFTCIIGDQFARSKKGDRYFYDIGDQPHSFTRAQIEEIRKASFARILCDNSDNLEAVQPSAFLLPDFDFNSLMDCNRSNRIPRLDLRAWINEPTP